MSDNPLDNVQPDPSSKPPPKTDGLDEVRELLFGAEKKELSELRKRMEDTSLRAEDLSQILPPAMAMCAQKDGQLAKALAPSIESAFKESIQKNPSRLYH